MCLNKILICYNITEVILMNEIKKELLNNMKPMAIKLDRGLTEKEALLFMTEEQFETHFKNKLHLLSSLCNSFTKEELIEILKNKTNKLGRSPYNIEMTFPQTITFINVFGSWENALKEAKLKFEEIPKDFKIEKPIKPYKTRFNKDNILNLIKEQYEKTGKIPTFQSIKGVSTTTIIKYFGSFSKALIEAGFNPKNNNINNIKEEKEIFNIDSIEQFKNKEYKYIHIKDLLKLYNLNKTSFSKESGIKLHSLKRCCRDLQYLNDEMLEYISERFCINKDIILPQKKLKHILSRIKRIK